MQHIVVALDSLVPFYRNTFGDQWWNPEGLPDVHVRLRNVRGHDEEKALTAFLDADPEVLITKQVHLMALLEGSLPETTRWWLPSSCQAFALAWRRGEVGSLSAGLERLDELFPNGARPSRREYPGERWSADERRHGIEAADRVTCNSLATEAMFRASYPEHVSKIEALPEWFAAVVKAGLERSGQVGRPFGERSIDLLFVASRWDRGEKNLELTEALIDEYACRCSVHLAGHGPLTYSKVFTHGPVGRSEILSLMADARVLVVPSLLDSAPSVVYEGLGLGCNVVASRNCGNWGVCAPELLVENASPAGFIRAIDRARERPYEGRLEAMTAEWPTARLVEPLLALERSYTAQA